MFRHHVPHQTGTPNFTSAKEKNKFPIPTDNLTCRRLKHPTPHPVKQLEHFQAHTIVSLPLNITTYE